MNRTGDIFHEKFSGFLNELGVKNLDSISFIITPTSEKENYTTWDDIFRMWSIPTFKGIRLKYNEVVNNLAKETRNTMPLWIKVSIQGQMPIVLEISQRFRKPREIFERRPENLFSPFELDDEKKIETYINCERLEAIRILIFKRLLDKRLEEIIGNEIHIKEIKDTLRRHLQHYRFYPASPSHQKIGDANFSEIVIKQDYKTGKFSLCKAEDLDDELESNLSMTEAIEYYIEYKIKDEFFGIKIKHSA